MKLIHGSLAALMKSGIGWFRRADGWCRHGYRAYLEFNEVYE